MGNEFTFYDYIDADGDGTNVIKSWLNNDGKGSKAYFIWLIPHLEASSPPGAKDTHWVKKYVKNMDKEWDGFIELRKTGSVQYRLIGQRRDRDVLLVASGIHKDQNFRTTVSPRTASNRVNQMVNDSTKYRKEHEYN